MGRKPKQESQALVSHDVKKSIIAVLFVTFAIIFLLSLFGSAGIVGVYIDSGLGKGFGFGRYLLPFFMIFIGVMYFRIKESKQFAIIAIGAVVFFVTSLGLMHIFKALEEMSAAAGAGIGGGYTGFIIAYPFAKYLGSIASPIVLIALWLVGVMVTFDFPIYRVYKQMLEKLEEKRAARQSQDEEDEESEEEEDEETVSSDKDEELGDNIKSIEFVEGPSDEAMEEELAKPAAAAKAASVAKHNIYSGIDWKLPPLDILEENDRKPKLSNLDENADIIKRTLHNFNIEVEFAGYNVGPTVTQYTFKPAVGVKLSRILALQNDLALALAAHPIRIEAPIPGKSLIGVEVPNKTKAMVRMRSMLESDEFQNRPSNLSLAFGEDVNGQVVIGNIERMPHMMIAGSTGTGKSVCINSVLTTLLYQNSPEQLRLILVDPKRVELSMYNGIPHLLTPVIVENSKVVNALKWAVGEMERRYKLLQEVGSRDIHSYNDQISKGKMKKNVNKATGEVNEQPYEKIPFIVIIIDELADLMAAHAKEVEGLIVRLAQMARAVGIHLIVSTQRPSVEVLTGLIKANQRAPAQDCGRTDTENCNQQ